MLFDVNGNPREYHPPPHGNTLSAQSVWEYSSTGRAKLFALRQQNALGILVDDPPAPSVYLSARTSDMAVMSIRDTIGRWRPFANVSTSMLSRRDSDGVFDQRSRLRSWQGHAEIGYAWSARFIATGGLEAERIAAMYDTRFPVNSDDPLAGAPSSRSTLDRAGLRDAAFLQLDTRPLASAEVVAGVRSDRSDFATTRAPSIHVSRRRGCPPTR